MTDLEKRLEAMLTPGGLAHVTMWDAINEYVIACGGDPSKRAHGNIPRMNAVASVDRIVLSAFRALVEAVKQRNESISSRDMTLGGGGGGQYVTSQISREDAAILAILDGKETPNV